MFKSVSTLFATTVVSCNTFLLVYLFSFIVSRSYVLFWFKGKLKYFLEEFIPMGFFPLDDPFSKEWIKLNPMKSYGILMPYKFWRKFNEVKPHGNFPLNLSLLCNSCIFFYGRNKRSFLCFVILRFKEVLKRKLSKKKLKSKPCWCVCEREKPTKCKPTIQIEGRPTKENNNK